MELADCLIPDRLQDFSAKLPARLCLAGFLMPAPESEMKLDLSPCWITVRRRNRQLTVRFISCAFVSPGHVRFHVETPRRQRKRKEKQRKESRGRKRERVKKGGKRKNKKRLCGCSFLLCSALSDPLVFRNRGARIDMKISISSNKRSTRAMR